MIGPGSYPNCSVCGKPVEMLTRHMEPSSVGVVIFTAYCHGEYERVELREEQLLSLESISMGEAFKQKHALPAQGQAR